MRTTKVILWIVLAIALLVVAIIGINTVLTGLIDRTNDVCRGQTFSSVEDAIIGMQNDVNSDDSSLDYSPPYNLLSAFEYDEFTVVMYSYEEASENECAIRLLHKNDDGSFSFVGGFTNFYFSAPTDSNPDYYYYTNAKTSHGVKTVSFLYLPLDTSSDLYVDEQKAQKIKVSIGGEEFFVCAAMSGRDTLLKNILVPICDRHNIEVK